MRRELRRAEEGAVMTYFKETSRSVTEKLR
jgi:hypothetical protein